jgi:phage terminase large subunit-like protein
VTAQAQNAALAEEYEELLTAECKYRERTKIARYYPDSGPYRRELYPKHLRFFALGKEYRERMLMAANRVGKSTVGCYETTVHATGRYPDWWEGKRFEHPISCIVAGDTNLTTRDILQTKLFGKLSRAPGDSIAEAVGLGTGMMPYECIFRATRRPGLPDALESVLIHHVSGGYSMIKLRSFEQGIEAFQGTEEDLIWLDENFPQNIYSECITRLMTTEGHLLLTFTPIQGVTAVIREFMDKAYRG